MTQIPNTEALQRDSRPAAVRRGRAGRPATAADAGLLSSLGATARTLLQRSFLVFVVAPTLLAFVYLQFFATRQYVTEFQFTILPLNISQSSSSSSGSGAGAGQSPVVGGSSSGGSSALLSVMDNMVISYLESQQAVIDAQKQLNLKAMFDSGKVDPLQRFWWNNGSFERLTDYWRLFVVNSSYDVTTGLCDVTVKAYTPEDSARIARTLVNLSEQLVNNQSLRQRHDTVAYAESEFRSAQDRMNKALSAEQAFRSSHQSIDPSLNGTANQTLAAGLQASLATLRAQHDALQKVSPGAPALALLDSQIQSIEQQLLKVSGNIGSGDVSGGAGTARVPISSSMQEFEAIEAEKNFATQNYTANLANLTSANFAAAQQQFYLEPFVEPVTPQSPTYPQPLIGAALVFVGALALWGMWTLFYEGTRRHG